MSTHDRRARFRALHERDELFVMPNPWDVGSARLLAVGGLRGAGDDEPGLRVGARQAGSDRDARRARRACRRARGRDPAAPQRRQRALLPGRSRWRRRDRRAAGGGWRRRLLDRGLRPGYGRDGSDRRRDAARRGGCGGGPRGGRAARPHRARREPHPWRRRPRRHDRPARRVPRCGRRRRLRAGARRPRPDRRRSWRGRSAGQRPRAAGRTVDRRARASRRPPRLDGQPARERGVRRARRRRA